MSLQAPYVAAGEQITAAEMNSLFAAADAKITALLYGKTHAIPCVSWPASFESINSYIAPPFFGEVFFFVNDPQNYYTAALYTQATGWGSNPMPGSFSQAAADAAAAALVVNPSHVGSATLTNAGTGYLPGDVLTVVGGTFITPASIDVTKTYNGIITGFTIGGGGSYYINPQASVSPTNVQVTGGHGSGATFNLQLNYAPCDATGNVVVAASGSYNNPPGLGNIHVGNSLLEGLKVPSWTSPADGKKYQIVETQGANYHLHRPSAYGVAEIVCDGVTSFAIDPTWNKFSFYRVHNLNYTQMTVTLPGGTQVKIPALGVRSFRLLANGTWVYPYNYFFQFESGDPRFFYCQPPANLYWPITRFAPTQPPGLNQYDNHHWTMGANNVSNPALLHAWLDFFETVGRLIPDRDVLWTPSEAALYGNPALATTLIGDLTTHQGTLVVATATGGGSQFTYTDIAFTSWANLAGQLRAAGLTVAQTGKTLTVQEGRPGHVTDLIGLSSNCIKYRAQVSGAANKGYICASAININSAVTLSDAFAFAASPLVSLAESGQTVNGVNGLQYTWALASNAAGNFDLFNTVNDWIANWPTASGSKYQNQSIRMTAYGPRIVFDWLWTNPRGPIPPLPNANGYTSILAAIGTAFVGEIEPGSPPDIRFKSWSSRWLNSGGRSMDEGFLVEPTLSVCPSTGLPTGMAGLPCYPALVLSCQNPRAYSPLTEIGIDANFVYHYVDAALSAEDNSPTGADFSVQACGETQYPIQLQYNFFNLMSAEQVQTPVRTCLFPDSLHLAATAATYSAGPNRTTVLANYGHEIQSNAPGPALGLECRLLCKNFDYNAMAWRLNRITRAVPLLIDDIAFFDFTYNAGTGYYQCFAGGSAGTGTTPDNTPYGTIVQTSSMASLLSSLFGITATVGNWLTITQAQTAAAALGISYLFCAIGQIGYAYNSTTNTWYQTQSLAGGAVKPASFGITSLPDVAYPNTNESYLGPNGTGGFFFAQRVLQINLMCSAAITGLNGFLLRLMFIPDHAWDTYDTPTEFYDADGYNAITQDITGPTGIWQGSGTGPGTGYYWHTIVQADFTVPC
ncbi:MAG: hypothetical protein ABSE16_08460 [Verrucomicrobiota bacterium]|jgi:hypothetical protein